MCFTHTHTHTRVCARTELRTRKQSLVERLRKRTRNRNSSISSGDHDSSKNSPKMSERATVMQRDLGRSRRRTSNGKTTTLLLHEPRRRVSRDFRRDPLGSFAEPFAEMLSARSRVCTRSYLVLSPIFVQLRTSSCATRWPNSVSYCFSETHNAKLHNSTNTVKRI